MSNSKQSDQLIRLKAVSRAYPTRDREFYAIDRVTLTIEKGVFSAVVGRSGSGKTTLVNLIAGLDRPSAGEIWVGGAAVHTMSEDQLASWRGRNVGVVFQFFQLLPTLTVAENVMLPMDFCSTFSPKQAKERALLLLEQMGIADQSDKLPTALSGGQQQRAALARALANDPALIVADEPTGNLDAHTSATVLDLLGELARQGRTVLMVTHERDVSSRVDQIIRLSDGKVVSDGSISRRLDVEREKEAANA